jgi:filamentous hemagglutinin
VIVSTADKEKNRIEAQSMTVKNLDNKMEAETKSVGVAVTPSGLPVPVVGQPGHDEDKGKTLATISGPFNGIM